MCLLEVLPRLRTRARLLEGLREGVVRIGIVGRKLDRLPEFRDRGSPVAILQFLPADAQRERRSLGVGLAARKAVRFLPCRVRARAVALLLQHLRQALVRLDRVRPQPDGFLELGKDRKSTRLNSSHLGISYAVFCLKKKTANAYPTTKIKDNATRRK